MTPMIAAIPISISPFFWFLAAMIGWLQTGNIQGSMIWMAVILGSVLVHEFGHALTARAFGQQVRIQLAPFGGLTIRKGERLALWKEFLVVLNGPLAGLSLAGAGYFLLWQIDPLKMPIVTYITWVTVQINIFWTLINLLPVGPLDGGQLLRISFEWIFGFRGIKYAHFVSIIMGVGLGLLFMAIRLFLVGALFFILAFESYRAWRQVLLMSPEDQDEELQTLFRKAVELGDQGRHKEAVAILKRVQNDAGHGVLEHASGQMMASYLADDGRHREAYDLLKPYRPKLDMSGLALFQEVAYHLKLWKEALEAGTVAFRENPESNIALINARCSGRLSDARQALGWLESSRRGGHDLVEVVESDDFEAVRTDSHFRDFVESLTGDST
ncbi:Uncharacterized protein SCG7086_AY_00060 [Chlamydiales bacterium SCGC AG-110-P3]|nr:Uncharacterized protein SCG7086_AY_00060 [Chlamydiales bacterium SCGC AG-110-P3]